MSCLLPGILRADGQGMGLAGGIPGAALAPGRSKQVAPGARASLPWTPSVSGTWATTFALLGLRRRWLTGVRTKPYCEGRSRTHVCSV